MARGQADKLIGRHPHVYGEAVAGRRAAWWTLWERRKREERDGAEGRVFYDFPAGLPALAYATKTQKRAAAVGFDFPDVAAALGKLREETAELRATPGRASWATCCSPRWAAARAVGADPELALRATASGSAERVERASALAAEAGEPTSSSLARPAAEVVRGGAADDRPHRGVARAERARRVGRPRACARSSRRIPPAARSSRWTWATCTWTTPRTG